MANLIPPDAKRAVAIEYWLRVLTVWFVLVGLAVLVVAILKVPTLVLVQSQLRAYSGAYSEAIDKTNQFTDAQDAIIEANDLSFLLLSGETTEQPTEILEILESIAGSEVDLKNYVITKEKGVITKIGISGIANTRIALADFSKDIEAHERFLEAELPISNLAKDRDIAFSIDIKLEVN